MIQRIRTLAIVLAMFAISCTAHVAYTDSIPSYLIYPTIQSQLPARAQVSKSPSRTLTTPVGDGVRVGVPPVLAGDRLAEMGFVSVTNPLFGADPTGAGDSTQAIRKAVEFARDNQMVCWFPLGTYLVSDTISCAQNFYMRTTGKLNGAELFPCVLMGEKGADGDRPLIRLADGSPGYSDPASPKYVLHFWARSLPHTGRGYDEPQPNINMNQMLVGVDVAIGKGNPGAVAVRIRGAQGSGVEDCTIDVGSGLTGLEGGCGSGGGFHNVRILGGQIGLDMTETQPTPTISGITLERQSRHALIYRGRQSLSAVGLRILAEGGTTAIAGPREPMTAHNGQICLKDAEVLFLGAPGELVDTASSLYLENVYVSNAKVLVRSKSRVLATGLPGQWVRIAEYAFGAPPKDTKGYSFSAGIYQDGRATVPEPVLFPDQLPPGDLFRTHLWPADFPAFTDRGAANVRTYGAKGDDATDDTDALQKAIDENEIVFLPKGYYVISRPLLLRPDTKLIGAAKHLSMILPDFSAPAFSNPAAPSPLVRTADTADADTVVAFLCLYTPRAAVGSYALDWRCGGSSVLRDPLFDDRPLGGKSHAEDATRDAPALVASGHGGGNWYDIFLTGWKTHGRAYRHLLVDGATGPLRIYQLDLEHARGRANAEFRDASDISVFGLKGEGNQPVLLAVRSRLVRIYGYGGNSAALPGSALFQFRDCKDFLAANLVDSPRTKGGKKESLPGIGVPPDEWNMLTDSAEGSGGFRTPPTDRPVLYKRGNPNAPQDAPPATAASTGAPAGPGGTARGIVTP